MMIVKFRSESEAKDTLKKLKKMKAFVHEMIECFEEKLENEEDDDEDYRYDDEYENMNERRGSYRRGRYRRGM